MNGLLGNIRGALGPDAGLKAQAIGDTLIGLGMGQPVASPAYNALMQRQQRAEQMRALEDSGMIGSVPENIRPLIAQLPPEAAVQWLLNWNTREPAQRRIIDGADGFKYYEDGTRVLPNVQLPGEKPEPPVVREVTLPDGSEALVQWDEASKQWIPAPIPQGGTGAQPVGDLTEQESRMALFSSLQSETAPVLAQIEEQWNPANLPDATARSIPIAGNYFQSEEGQQYSAAATVWAEGALRLATGAQANAEEIANTRNTYFAQPGDTPGTVVFKARLREAYMRAINAARGQPVEGKLELPEPVEFAESVSDSLDMSVDEALSIAGGEGGSGASGGW